MGSSGSRAGMAGDAVSREISPNAGARWQMEPGGLVTDVVMGSCDRRGYRLECSA